MVVVVQWSKDGWMVVQWIMDGWWSSGILMDGVGPEEYGRMMVVGSSRELTSLAH